MNYGISSGNELLELISVCRVDEGCVLAFQKPRELRQPTLAIVFGDDEVWETLIQEPFQCSHATYPGQLWLSLKKQSVQCLESLNERVLGAGPHFDEVKHVRR